MHLDVAFATLFDLLTTPRLLFLMAIAVPMGVFFGSTPGLGGKLGLVLLIPFVYNMDQLTGAVFLCAMHAVVHTGGSIPSILIGVPGDGPAAATALDGYAMTKKGEAGRALGASFGASTVGGLLGAMFLGLSLPILEPIILNFSPAEFFLLAILGITFIATLSGDSFVKGMIVGLFGLMCAFIGLDPSTGSPRFTFGQIWLWDGLSVIVAVLSMFAVPEMISLGVKGRAYDISAETAAKLQGSSLTAEPVSRNVTYAQIFQGMRDVAQHKWLVLRCSLLVAAIGVIPGLGGDAAAWMAYGHTVQSSKHPERFGKGEVAGVIGAETGSCAKEADLVLRRAGLVGHGDHARGLPDARHSARTNHADRACQHRLVADLGARHREHPCRDHADCRRSMDRQTRHDEGEFSHPLCFGVRAARLLSVWRHLAEPHPGSGDGESRLFVQTP
jgi:putative tricarboxylic transport membrane protein